MLPYMDIERNFFKKIVKIVLQTEMDRNGLELAGMDRNSNQNVLTPFHFG